MTTAEAANRLLRIYLFGQIRLEYDGAALKFSALPKALPLWAYLLLHRAQPVERAALAFTLWPDESEPGALANLRRHLHELRRVLPAGQPWLLSDGNTVRWNPAAAYWLDVAEFEQFSAADETLPQAVALYGADLLESVYDDWLLYERERLHNLYSADLNRLILQSRAQADLAAALGYAQLLFSRDPLHEDALRQLMTLRYETGDRSGAVQEYEHFVRLLRRELSVDPMPETLALYEAIARNARLPGALPPAEPAPGGKRRAASAALPFVGREAAMQALHERWSRATRGNGGLLLISGEAGIGKTRLVAELARQAERAGARVLLGSNTFGEPLPYQALAEALRAALPLLVALDIDPLWLAAVSTLIPELRARRARTAVALPALAPLDHERERTRLFEGIARCLQAMAAPRPVLLILEDLHWAGAATADLLEFLTRAVAADGVLIVGTYRDEETLRAHPLRELRRRLQREDPLSHLALGRLPSEAVAALVPAIAGLDSGQDGGLAHRLYRESEGNPFFLGELIRELLEPQSGGEAPGDGERPTADAALQLRGVRALIAGRVARLSPASATLAEIAAVASQEFDVELLREVSGWDEQRVLAGLDELLDRQLIREAGSRSLIDYVFSHYLIQAAIYADIAPQRRERRHRRIGQVLEEIAKDRLDELAADLARHFDLGAAPELAVGYYLRAARRALQVYADAEATQYLSRALELTGAAPLRFELLALREAIHRRRGERDEQATDLAEMKTLAAAAGDEEAICETLRREILLRRALGERQAEAALIAALKQRAAASGSPHWQAEALEAEAAHLLLLSQYEAARAALAQALELRAALGDAAGQALCCALLAEAAVLQGQFDEAEQLLQRATQLGGTQANQSVPIATLHVIVRAALVRQDFATVYALGTQLLELCRTTGDRAGEAEAHVRLAAAASRRFMVAEARQHYAQAGALFAALGDRNGQAAILVNAGMLAGNLGRFAEAISAARQAERIFAALDDLRGQTVSALNIAWNALQLPDYGAAKDAAARALSRARAMQSPLFEAFALANLGAAERAQGDLPQAIAHMRAGLAIRRTIGQPVEIAGDLCDLAVAYLRGGDLTAAQEAVGEMLALAAANPEQMSYPQYILWVAAQTARATGDTAAATQLLAAAADLVREKAAAIGDAASRATYLQMSFNREVLAAQLTGAWPSHGGES
jgi:predicted ATPase/DNA-binding SARP family transcriptional activator